MDERLQAIKAAMSSCALDAPTTVDMLFEQYPDKTGRLLNVLNDVQELYRYLPADAIARISQLMDVPEEQIVRMGQFFGHLSLDPVGRCIIDVCDGTACHTQGSVRLISEFEKVLGIKVGQTTADGMVTLRTVGCVGACGIAPVVVADDEAYGRVRVTHVQAIADAARQKDSSEEGEL